jgi:UDP-N-acetylglucosamine acyltransferase
VFAERVAAVRAEHGDEPLVEEMLAFIAAPSKRGLIRAARTADPDDAA